MNKCSKSKKLICPECKLPLELDFFGKKCPRCNHFLFSSPCESCFKKCNK